MKKVVLYVRVSTEEQAEEGFSINGQIKVLEDYCQRNKLQIVSTYKDEGFSGKSLDRPSLKELLKDCESEEFDMVMVWKINRLSRKQLDFLTIVDYLEKHDISLFSFSENIDASTSVGKAMFQMMGSFAELERNQIVENVKMGMTQRAKEGKFNGGSVLGFSSKDKRLIINNNEANLVKYIFDLYISGKGYKAIANKLNHEGYKTKRNSNFSINSIKTIITNPMYAGFIRFNQVENWSEKRRKGKGNNMILEKGEHDPIISMEIWEKAQKINEQKSHKPSKTFTGHFPLTTLLRCPKCGHGMIGHKTKRSKNSKEYLRYYQCGNYRNKGSAVCNSNLIKADEVEMFIFKKLEEITSKPIVLKSIVGKVNEKIITLKEPIKERLNYILEKIKQVDKSINKFLTIIEKTSNPLEPILDKLSELDKEKKVLLEQKVQLEYELNKPTVREISLEQLQNVLSTFSKILPNVAPEKQKDLLHSIINKITVNEGDKPEKRSVKDIELYFDASKNNNYVLTYGMVHPD
ncbi:resolvase [Anaerobacillus alkalidiazotrophicus]|uniref:Resolvase n=1 Tax=Anaerobacillus alkalidiazotrophicus TaxID=472963 RepID=A0A1S2MB43_9BACI|nr:recombinase family protein [Anaerobacillus alkalidiazotrophicus]OIJ21879.1 resolvase [Anaerobacillus alkalidiazotrophicus]